MLETAINNLTTVMEELVMLMKMDKKEGTFSCGPEGVYTETVPEVKCDIVEVKSEPKKETEVTYDELNKIALKLVEVGKLTEAKALLESKYKISSLQDASVDDYAEIESDLLALMS